MRQGWRVLLLVVLILAGVAIGVGAYNAGVSHGVAESGKATQVVRVVGPGGFFPFGFFIFPLVFFGVFVLFRWSFGSRRWHPHDGRWSQAPWGGPERFEERAREWHRQQHHTAPADPRDGPPDSA
jgi:hypothetical protein